VFSIEFGIVPLKNVIKFKHLQKCNERKYPGELAMINIFKVGEWQADYSKNPRRKKVDEITEIYTWYHSKFIANLPLQCSSDAMLLHNLSTTGLFL